MGPRKEGVKSQLLFCRNQLNEELTFKQFIMQTRQTVIEAFNYSDYSFAALYQELLTSNDTGTKGPLEIFNVAFIYDRVQDKGKVLRQFHLVFVLSRQENQGVLQVEYNADLYPGDIVQRFSRNFVNMFEDIAGKLDQSISKMKVLCPQEQEELFEFNRTGAWYPANKTIHELFAEQVKRTPDHTALVGQIPNPGFQNSHYISITYNELNWQANRLARLLRERGVTGGTIVGIMLSRTVEMIAALLAVMKAGGTYLPIDPGVPEKRILSMLDDCHAPFLLTDNTVLDTRTHSFTNGQGLGSTAAPIYLAQPREPITDFDSLGFPQRSLIDYEKYNRFIGQAIVKNRMIIQASRGCPHHCSYCYRIWPRKQVARSAENIFQEIMIYYNIGIKKFDIFMLNINQGKRLFQLIIKNKLDDLRLFFPNGFRGDLLTKEYIDLMVKAGTVNFALALETASPRLQKLINKHLDIEKFRENVEYICEKYPQVILELFTMHGIPGETPEEAAQTLEFIKRLKWIHFPYVNVLKIYSNTGMEKLALEHGITKESILRSENMAWHEWSDTLPFSRQFTAKYQAEFLGEYVLSKERLLAVIPHQMNILDQDEFLQKYNSYLPNRIDTFDDLLRTAGIRRDELDTKDFRDQEEDEEVLQHLNQRIKRNFPTPQPSKNALRILLLDLSQYFTAYGDTLYDVVDPPLGMMYLLTYLNARLGDKIHGKIMKSRLDFDSYQELKNSLDEFSPHVIGIRTLSYYKDFFHQTVAAIRHWGIDVPIITGGPYATVDYQAVLQDRNIDLAVIGEGELTFCEITEKIIENKGKLPDPEALKQIKGIAFAAEAGKFARSPRGSSREIMILDEWTQNSSLTGKAAGDLLPLNQAHPLAYIVFTSGSTGKPKGVPIEHRNAVNVLTWFGKTYNLQTGTHVIQVTNNTFDPSVEQIFATLLHGGVVYVPPGDITADEKEFAQYVEQNQIHMINFVPGILKDLLEQKKENGSLEIVISGGETLEESVKNSLIKKGYRLYNHYGPTETTIDALTQQCAAGDPVTLGKPIANCQVYIMGENNLQLPIGVAGELCIAGAGVARGYLNRPELTAEKFIELEVKVKVEEGEAPRQQIPNKHMSYTSHMSHVYKTGDIALRLPDGKIEFLGRSDQQIKIRGYRIELGEIESCLLAHKEIKEVVVMAIDDLTDNIEVKAEQAYDKYLCAYYVGTARIKDTPDASELRQYLWYTLPGYMIPAYFVPLERIPRNPNQKIDRKALPHPQTKITENFVAPTNETEEKMAQIWAQLLEMDKENIGIDANFFQLGGHSLKATVLVAKIHKEFNVKLPLAQVFKTSTIRKLAGCIRAELKKDTYTPIEPAEKKDYYHLSSAQKRIFIQQQMELNNISYNMPLVYPLTEEPEGVKLEETFNQLIRRHDSFRTSFHMLENEPVQRVHDTVEFKIEYLNRETPEKVPAKEANTRPIKAFTRPFDLSQAPLLRVGIQKTGNKENRLLLDMHHIISDGISMEILVKEFFVMYTDTNAQLPGLKLQYKDYSQWQNRLFQSGVMQKQEEYWLNQFKGKIPVMNLPTDDPTNSDPFGGMISRFSLGEELSLRIHRFSLENESTKYMILLAGLNILLAKYMDQEDIMVGAPIFGRKHPDLLNIVGMFVNMLPMRNYPQGGKTFATFLKEVKENALAAYENQDYQYEQLIWELDKLSGGQHHLEVNIVVDLDIFNRTASHHQDEAETKDRVMEFPDLKVNMPKFDLMMVAMEEKNEMILDIVYRCRLFKKSTIERMAKHLKNILEQVITNPKVNISEINMLSEEEESKLIKEVRGETDTTHERAGKDKPDKTEKINVEFDI
jgi:amino acid adenylation domain-containing protein